MPGWTRTRELLASQSIARWNWKLPNYRKGSQHQPVRLLLRQRNHRLPERRPLRHKERQSLVRCLRGPRRLLLQLNRRRRHRLLPHQPLLHDSTLQPFNPSTL